jgi:hypothetical protein
MVLAGGTHWKDDKKLWLDEVVAYDPEGDKWENLTPLPRPLAYDASASQDGVFYFGVGPGRKAQNGPAIG